MRASWPRESGLRIYFCGYLPIFIAFVCFHDTRARASLASSKQKERERKKAPARIFHACFALLRLASVLTHVFPYPPRLLEHFFVYLSPHGLPTKNCS